MRTLTLISLLLASSLIHAQSSLPKASAYEVQLTCTPPVNSPDPVAGYYAFRSLNGAGSYATLNQSPVTTCAYVDLTPQPAQTYDYIVESVDAQGVVSVPSNIATAAIPAVGTPATLGALTATS